MNIYVIYHLWYITYILICYMLTPLLQFLFDKQYKVRSICFIFFIIIFLMWIITGKLEMLWLISYIIGYFMGKFDFLNKLKKTYITVIIIIAVVACSIKVILSSISFTSIIGMLFVVYSYLTHILLGLMLFCVIYFVENKLYIVNRLYNILLFSMIDKLSYEIYLVHQIFILGTFSIILLCKSMFLNYMILAIMILLISFFLNFISGFISKKVKQLYNI
ncbi:MAG: acyltransferase family protein [[Clostridium] cocleatum]|uniref:acyltransferase family protein n=1 Tax=Thomasclavelia cocleata TaxID=69824 RepID=UPI003C6F5884|nr:acyltransferase family protein [Thomasclavelia cocleata]